MVELVFVNTLLFVRVLMFCQRLLFVCIVSLMGFRFGPPFGSKLLGQLLCVLIPHVERLDDLN